MFGKLEMDVAVPLPARDGKATIDGDDVDVGFNLAAMFELSDQTRLGVIYWSKIEPEFGGDVSLKPSGIQIGTDTKLTFPQFVRAGIYYELNDQWALLGTVAWEDWSELKYLFISTGVGTKKIPRNWDDTWHFALGARYRIDDQWLMQGGVAYDTSPVDAEDRTADMPVDRQIRLTVGTEYKRSEKVTYGVTLEYADLGEAEIKSRTLVGKYDQNGLLFLTFNVNWK